MHSNFTPALFTVSKIRKQLKCPTKYKQRWCFTCMNRYIHSGMLVIKRNEVLTFATI